MVRNALVPDTGTATMEIAGRTLPRETVVEAAAADAVVTAFIAAMLAIGATYGRGSNGVRGLTPEGGIALVGVIAAFVILVTLVGVWLATRSGSE